MDAEMTGSAGTPGHGERPLRRLSELTSGLRWRRVFPGEAGQLSVVRRWVESLLPGCPAREDVACVATELGTNAVRHTASGRGGWFAVEIAWYQGVVRVAVTDDGAADGPRMIDDPAAEDGRGLRLVAGLSVRTGVCGDRRGRMVWADVPWGGAAGAQTASLQAGFDAAIGAGEAQLAGRFGGVPVWFGRCMLQWWALIGGELVTAGSPGELSGLMSGALDRLASRPSAGRDVVWGYAVAGRGGRVRPSCGSPRAVILGSVAAGGGLGWTGAPVRGCHREQAGQAPIRRPQPALICPLPLASAAEPGGRPGCLPPTPVPPWPRQMARCRIWTHSRRR